MGELSAQKVDQKMGRLREGRVPTPAFLSIREKILGPDHFHLANSLADLGRVAYDAGDYMRAEERFRRALALNEKAFGQDHVQLLSSLNNLATLYATTGDYAKAAALYQRARAIYERVGVSNETVQNTRPTPHPLVIFRPGGRENNLDRRWPFPSQFPP